MGTTTHFYLEFKQFPSLSLRNHMIIRNNLKMWSYYKNQILKKIIIK
ncbi:hypothetical protein LEP1GSC151_1343 [Leptospira interrogans serovar Grippotyphosa str. LT2186]|uniref:Uncharacterized protein n=1 Tax=Leptospira interrogans serovar Grippotyphosa str. LT2186 TaxID=1001599 RepID=M3FXL6_LEPIR|nr:hypothetical protein LEP1GSC151_1343 [Leptospira interrogans serovar Grippotyphosa str. LT2186]